MAKYRVVQTGPKHFIVEYETLVKREIVSSRYAANEGYWRNSFRLNAGGKPSDFSKIVEEKQWKPTSTFMFNTIEDADNEVKRLQEGDLMDVLRIPFKAVVIKEYE